MLTPLHSFLSTTKFWFPWVPDEDWKRVANDVLVPNARVDELFRLFTNEELMKTLALIFSTKSQWWAINHHTGQSFSETIGFVRKVLRLKYNLEPSQASVHLTHTIGHWASTHYVLILARIPNILPTDPVADWAFGSISAQAHNLRRYKIKV